MHLVDITLLYSPASSAVKNYLSAKTRWLSSFGRLRHSIVVPRMKNENYGFGVLGIPSIPVPFFRNYRMPSSTRTATSMLSRLQPDCIEVGDPFQCAKAALEVKKSSKVPVVAFCHFDLSFLAGVRFGRLAEKAMTKYLSGIYRQFDLVLTRSARMAQKLREMGVSRARYQPLGVDTSVFNAVWCDHRLRARLALSSDARLLVHASLDPDKKTLCALMQVMEKLGPSYHLLIIGKGGSLPYSKQVSYISMPQDARALAALMASCDVLVHAEKPGGLGSLAKEAMACGLPVVGVSNEELIELVDETTGILVGNIDELAHGIRQAYEFGLDEMGRCARRKMVQHYDWNHILPQLMAQYVSLIVSSGRKSRIYSSEPFYADHP